MVPDGEEPAPMGAPAPGADSSSGRGGPRGLTPGPETGPQGKGPASTRVRLHPERAPGRSEENMALFDEGQRCFSVRKLSR